MTLNFSLQPRISKKFLITRTFFFLTVGQSNFGNKIPFLHFTKIFWPSYDKKDEMYLKQKIDGVVKIFRNLTNVKVGFGQNC